MRPKFLKARQKDRQTNLFGFSATLLAKNNFANGENVNFYARYTYGNRNKGGLKIMHWNAGGGFLSNKIEHIEQVIQYYHPHIFGISESQFRKDHDINDIQIKDYEIYLSKSLENPVSDTMET